MSPDRVGPNPSPPLDQRGHLARSWLYRLVIGLVVLLSVGQLVWSIAVLTAPGEIMYGEAIIHDHAARLLRGELLYQPLNDVPYTVAAYTPLYYVLVAGLQGVFGPGFLPGRALSLLAGAAAAVIVGLLTTRIAGARGPGLLAGLLFFAIGLGGGSRPLGGLLVSFGVTRLTEDPSPAWAALYKEDLLGVVLSLGSIAALAGRRSTPFVVLAGVLAAAALLTKQTFFAASIAGALWLWQVDRRRLVFFVGTVVLLVAAVSIGFEATTHAYIQNTLTANANPLAVEPLITNLKVFSLFQGGLVLAAAMYVIGGSAGACPGTSRRLLVLYWLASMLSCLGIAKVGANYNYWIELAAPTAALAALAIWQVEGQRPTWLARMRARVALPLVGANLALLVGLLGGPLIIASAQHSRTSADSAEFYDVVERVRSEPTEVLAAPLDVITLARRRVIFEPYIFSLWFSTAHWDPAPLVARICDGRVGLLVVDRPINQPMFEFDGYSSWPAPVIDVLQQRAVLEAYEGGRYLYRLSQPCARGV